MSLKHNSIFKFSAQLLFVVILGGVIASCVTTAPPRSIPISEQIVLDRGKAQELMQEFQKKIVPLTAPELQSYLNKLARNLASQKSGFESSTVEVKIFQELNLQQKRLYSFPGTTLFVPLSFLEDVQYENELAAALSYELGQVIHRHLVRRLEEKSDPMIPVSQMPIVMFGEGNIFNFAREENRAAINTATELLYSSRFDPRGVSSIFQRYSGYITGNWKDVSELENKENEFNIKEAQRARSQYSPLWDPTVRSGDFLMMKNLIAKRAMKAIKR